MRKPVLFFAALLAGTILLTGCVTMPDSIKGISPTPQQDLVRVMSAPKLFVGQESRFGGKVIKVVNQNGQTTLEIVAFPLDDTGRPNISGISIGRLFATIHGFVEPVDFNNRWVTVIGPITGTRKGKVGNANYAFVTMDVTGYQRWSLTRQIVAPPQPVAPWGWYDPGFGYWGAAPYGWYNYGPAQGRNNTNGGLTGSFRPVQCYCVYACADLKI